MIHMRRNSLFTLILVVLLCVGAITPAWSGILIFGGTGQLGSRIVRLLLEAGEDVTVFVRPTSDRSRLDGLAVDYVVGDLLNDADVAGAFASASYRAVIVAVRGTSHRMAISPTKSFCFTVATVNGPAGVLITTSASPSTMI